MTPKDLPKSDEWPNLSSVERPKFPDGDSVGPLTPPEDRPYGIFGVLVLLIILVVAFLLTTIFATPARADEPSVTIFEREGECSIDMDLRVRGNRTEACIDKISTALRLAKAEKMVNARRKKK